MPESLALWVHWRWHFSAVCHGEAIHFIKALKDCNLTAIALIIYADHTVYKGLKESVAHPAEFIAIIGAGGGLGSLATQYAKAMGLRTFAVGECCKRLWC